MLIDMGIHDFDLARWFMGDVRAVAAIGATIAYPELATVGDIDNAVASLTFTSGMLGAVDLSRSGIYGYDIATEILGSEGTLKIGYLRETPVMVLTKNSARTTPCRTSWNGSATRTRISCRTSRRTSCTIARRRSRSTTASRRCASASPRRARARRGGRSPWGMFAWPPRDPGGDR